MMRTLLSLATGGPETLVYTEAPPPVTGPGQVLIEVHAVGVNFPDALILQDLYQFKPQRPFAPGGEFAGIVVGLGPGVKHFAVGDRVAAMTRSGGMAEYAVADADTCVRLPDAMPFAEGASLLYAYGTASYSLQRRAALQSGESVAILGAAGGVGVASIECARALGAEVIACVSSDAKADFARQAGAQHTIVYPRGPLDREAQRQFSEQLRAAGGGAVDIVLDAAGGDYTEPALRALDWEGRLLIVGFPAGIARIPMNLVLLKSCQIVGVFWGEYLRRSPDRFAADAAQLFDWYARGLIRPRIEARFPLERGGEAIRLLADRQVMGKVVVEVRKSDR
jgi:NADPH:quinone reductase